MHPTPKACVLLAAAAPVALGTAIVFPAHWTMVMIWPVLLLAAVLLDMMALTRGGRLRAQVDMPSLVYLGEPASARVEVLGASECTVDGLLDVEGPLLPVNPFSLRLAPQAGMLDYSAQCQLSLALQSRGTAVASRLWLRTKGRFGLAQRTESMQVGAKSLISPNIPAVARQAMAFRAKDAPLGVKPQHQRGEGTEFESLRDYVEGMDPRSIDWKASAKHRSMVAREYETERNHHILLCLDTGSLMCERVQGTPKLDQAIVALLLLSYVSLKAGDRVGFCAFDSRSRAFIPPRGGTSTQQRIVRACAEVEYGNEETNFTLALADLRSRLTRRSLIVIATDFVDTITTEIMLANMQILARRHLVIFVTPTNLALEQEFMRSPNDLQDVARAVVARDLTIERRRVFTELDRLGVLIVEAPAQRLGGALVNRYLAVKTREML